MTPDCYNCDTTLTTEQGAHLTATEQIATEESRRGVDAFNRHVKPKLRLEDDGKFVAVDIFSGQYELDEDDYTAVARLHARVPGASVWLERVGQPAVYSIRRCP